MDRTSEAGEGGMSEKGKDFWGDGHGWVRPRRDGMVARCGGPSLCSKCALEQAQKVAAERRDIPVTPTAEGE